jgi:hypothetical protein
VGVIVIIIAIIFFFANVPDIKTEDTYHMDDSSPNVSHSIWTHPHFVMAVAAQFLYVAAQAGIFSFLINYMIAEPPPVPEKWKGTEATAPGKGMSEWIDVKKAILPKDIKDVPTLAEKLKQKSDPISAFLSSQLDKTTVEHLDRAATQPKKLRTMLAKDLNAVVHCVVAVETNRGEVVTNQLLYTEERFAGASLSDETKAMIAKKPYSKDLSRLNRMLLRDSYPAALPYTDGILGFTDKAGSNFVSLGFVLFLIGRFTGAGLLRKVSAHKLVGLYGLLNVIICCLVVFKFGWFSVVCVFLSYFFMSIMFPTIFALGIFGLGARAKKASAFIVMAIMGGALLPKLMGHVGDLYDMSRAFLVPMGCFAFVSFYGYFWPKFSKAESLHVDPTRGGH